MLTSFFFFFKSAVALHSAKFKKEGLSCRALYFWYKRFAHNWKLASLVHAGRDMPASARLVLI